MTTIKCFRDLEVWQRSMELVVECYVLTKAYPSEERYALARETRRSAVSIPSNIAEGHNRSTRNAYGNHINIALGSQGELETQLEVAIRLGYVSRAQARSTLEQGARVGQMLHALRRSLDSKHVG